MNAPNRMCVCVPSPVDVLFDQVPRALGQCRTSLPSHPPSPLPPPHPAPVHLASRVGADWRGAARAAAGRGGSPRRVPRGTLASPLGAARGSVSPVLRRHPPAVLPTGTACGPSRPHRVRAFRPPPQPRPPACRGCTTRVEALFHCCRRRAGGNRHLPAHSLTHGAARDYSYGRVPDDGRSQGRPAVRCVLQ